MMRMLSQFSAIYGQLFCCDCYNSFQNERCGNRTRLMTYPLSGRGNYAWLAGLFCLILFMVFTFVAAAVYCRYRRGTRKVELITVTKLTDTVSQTDGHEHQSNVENDRSIGQTTSGHHNQAFLDNEQISSVGEAEPNSPPDDKHNRPQSTTLTIEDEEYLDPREVEDTFDVPTDALHFPLLSSATTLEDAEGCDSCTISKLSYLQ